MKNKLIVLIFVLSCNEVDKKEVLKNSNPTSILNKFKIEFSGLNEFNTLYSVIVYKNYDNYIDSYEITNYYLNKIKDTFNLKIQAGEVGGIRIYFNLFKDYVLDVKSEDFVDLPTPFKNINIDSGYLQTSSNICNFKVFKGLGDTLGVVYFGRFKFEGHLPDSNYVFIRK